MDKFIWLDSASTTKPYFFAKDYAQYWTNPNSNHVAGFEANKQLNQARERIMRVLGVESGKVLFCRCATEAVEWLWREFEEQHYAPAILCSAYEHDSCYDIVGLGYNNQTSNKFVDLITTTEWDTTRGLYLHQHTNHITGTVFPIESIGKQVQSTGAFFGSDITAGLGKDPLPQNLDTFCDAVWFSGRKIHCETMGAIWLSDRLFKYLGGGEDNRNEFGLLHGTTNVPGAIALSYAVEHAVEEAWVMEAKTQVLISHLARSLRKNNIKFSIVADDQSKSYAINAITLLGINADALTNFLSSRGIYISPGHSACSDESDYRVLESFRLTKEQASQTVRVSFCEYTAVEDIDAFVQGVKEFKELFI